MGDGAKFHIPLFDGKINFSVWMSSVEDLLVQQGIDNALEKSKPTTMDEGKWVAVKMKAVSTIRLAIAPEIKYNYLMETDPGVLLEKPQKMYVSKSLTNKLCLRWELYQLMKEDDTSMQDHINTLNQLVCQLLNADEKLFDEEKALLLLASLPKSYKNIFQTLLLGRESTTLDEALAALRENDRFMERHDGEDKKGSSEALFGEGSRRRAKERGYQVRRKSQGRSDYTHKECHYCKKKRHIRMMCKEMKEDLKKMKDSKVGRRDGESSGSATLGFMVDDDYNGALLVDGGVTRSKKWVIDFGCSFHICCEKEKFLSLAIVMEALSPYLMMRGCRWKVLVKFLL